MKRLLIAATALIAMPVFGMVRCAGQSMDALNLQVHGYATQGFVYSTNNNWNTTDSTDGSAAWTEAVVNLTAQPQAGLRIGIQARYFLLGDYGNQITLDWAQADYKFNEKFGIRVGKVKTTAGQLNEYQDVDSALLWVVLPQGIYPLSSRASMLAHYGGVVYGTLALGESFGKLDYRAYGGQRVIGADDGYFQAYRDDGLGVPNGLSGPIFGGTLRWKTPIEGLMLGASATRERSTGAVTAYSLPGNGTLAHRMPDHFFATYERRKVTVAGESSRADALATIKFMGLPSIYKAIDDPSLRYDKLQALEQVDRRHLLQQCHRSKGRFQQLAVPEGLGDLFALRFRPISLPQNRTACPRRHPERNQYIEQSGRGQAELTHDAG